MRVTGILRAYWLFDDDLRSRVRQSLLNGSRIEGARLGDSSSHIGKVARPGLGVRHPGDFVATAHQLGDERPADRSARPGDEDPHGSLIYNQGIVVRIDDDNSQ